MLIFNIFNFQFLLKKNTELKESLAQLKTRNRILSVAVLSVAVVGIAVYLVK